MNKLEDMRMKAKEYLKELSDPSVSGLQPIAKELCKEINAETLESMLALFEEYNQYMLTAYREKDFEIAREDYHLQQVLNANRILVCPAITRIVDSDGIVNAMCSLAYISIDSAEVGDVSYAVVSDLEYHIKEKQVNLPPLLQTKEEQEEELIPFEDYGDLDVKDRRKWETENAIFGQFLMAAKTLTLTGYEVHYLISEKKSIDIHGSFQDISFPRLEIFNPLENPPKNLCIVNLYEYSQRPEIVLANEGY